MRNDLIHDGHLSFDGSRGKTSGYFLTELVHCGIFTSRLLNDPSERQEERWILLASILIAVVAATACARLVAQGVV